MALIPKEPKQQGALLVLMLALGGLYAFHQYWYTPKRERVGELEARLEQLETQNRRSQILAVRAGPELQERLVLYERHLMQLEQLIPQREEVPTLLNAMALEARHTRVDMALMRPLPSEVGPHYTKQTYEIQVVGEYHAVGRFLTSIGSLSRIITPINLDVVPFTGDAGQLDFEAPVTASFQIQTYVLPRPGDGGSPPQAALGGDR